MIDNDELLKDACDHIISRADLQPVKDSSGKITKTFCNEGAWIVAQALGCDDLTGMIADEQYYQMSANVSGKWRKVTGQEAVLHALSGKLGFAAMPSAVLGDDHGHIAAIYPASQTWSNSLGRDVPMVANVGKIDGEIRASQAFPVSKGEPDYFIWEG